MKIHKLKNNKKRLSTFVKASFLTLTCLSAIAVFSTSNVYAAETTTTTEGREVEVKFQPSDTSFVGFDLLNLKVNTSSLEKKPILENDFKFLGIAENQRKTGVYLYFNVENIWNDFKNQNDYLKVNMRYSGQNELLVNKTIDFRNDDVQLKREKMDEKMYVSCFEIENLNLDFSKDRTYLIDSFEIYKEDALNKTKDQNYFINYRNDENGKLLMKRGNFSKGKTSEWVEVKNYYQNNYFTSENNVNHYVDSMMYFSMFKKEDGTLIDNILKLKIVFKYTDQYELQEKIIENLSDEITILNNQSLINLTIGNRLDVRRALICKVITNEVWVPNEVIENQIYLFNRENIEPALSDSEKLIARDYNNVVYFGKEIDPETYASVYALIESEKDVYTFTSSYYQGLHVEYNADGSVLGVFDGQGNDCSDVYEFDETKKTIVEKVTGKEVDNGNDTEDGGDVFIRKDPQKNLWDILRETFANIGSEVKIIFFSVVGLIGLIMLLKIVGLVTNITVRGSGRKGHESRRGGRRR